DEKSSAYSRPVSGSIAHTGPAAMIGEPSRGDGAFHAMLNEVWLTESATRPSAHGTSIIGPDQAVPPHAPAQTFALAIWPPTPPSWAARRRYATPSLPTATTTPRDGSSVAPTEPRSVSPASRDRQLAGAKYDRAWRSGDSGITEWLYAMDWVADPVPVTT